MGEWTVEKTEHVTLIKCAACGKVFWNSTRPETILLHRLYPDWSGPSGVSPLAYAGCCRNGKICGKRIHIVQGEIQAKLSLKHGIALDNAFRKAEESYSNANTRRGRGAKNWRLARMS